MALGRLPRSLLLAWLLAGPQAAAETPVVQLDRAGFRLAPPARQDPPRPPPAAAGELVEVALPDRWPERGGGAGVGWYRLRLPALEVERLGIFLPRVHANAVAYRNGVWLGQGGRFAWPGARAWNHPLYFTVAGGAAGWLDVGVQGWGSPRDGLGAVAIGPDDLLRPRFERAYAVRVGAARAGTIVAGVLVALFTALWLGLDRDPVYGVFALSGGFFVVANLNYHWLHPPLGPWLFNGVVNVALDGVAVCFVLLVLRLVGLRWRLVERAVLGYGVAAAGLALTLPGPVFDRALPAVHAVAGVLAAASLGLLFAYRQRLSVAERTAYLSTGAVMVAIALADLTVQVGLRPSGSTRLMPLLAPVMLLGFGAALLLRFLAVYRRAQQQNVVLEARVAEKHAELEENFARLNALERQRAVVAERERLMREMHDGLGGELVAALAVVEGDERAPTAVGDALKHALDEMRLVILSLDPWLRGIPELLGAMRSRLEPRLASHGVRFRWEIRDLPPTPGLGASGSLQVLRVVQEAVSNALQHADARTIALSTGTDDDERHVFVAIRDDGRGFDAAKPGGRGLLNMRERARELGGTLEVESGTSGTCVRLWVPVDGGRDA